MLYRRGCIVPVDIINQLYFTTRNPGFLLKLQDALKEGKWEEVIEIHETALNRFETYHCHIVKEKILKFRTGDQTQIKAVFRELIALGYMESECLIDRHAKVR